MRNIFSNNPRVFLYITIGIVAIIILSSCMTTRKGELTERGKNFIATHCNGSDSVVTNHEVIFKDTTLYITERGETIYIPSPCDSIKPISIVKKKNGLTSTVKTIGNVISFDCEADSLRAVIKTLERRSTSARKERIVIEKPCELDHISGTKWAFIRIGQWFLVFLSVQILLKILISFYPVTRPFIGWAYLFKF